jgi:glutathionyl-hydroquinone reductase
VGRSHHRPGAPDLFPEDRRDEIMEIEDANYRDVNNAVYEAGFSTDAGLLRRGVPPPLRPLDWLETRLATKRYLVGDTITEADVRLWPTLVRFDAVYHNHFKCNRNKLTEMPALWGYARDLFQTPGFGDTIDFPQIKAHYYGVHRQLNPSGRIVRARPEDSVATGWAPSVGTPPTPEPVSAGGRSATADQLTHHRLGAT